MARSAVIRTKQAEHIVPPEEAPPEYAGRGQGDKSIANGVIGEPNVAKSNSSVS